MMETISVIIPVYNAEKTIEKCVESIVHGEYREIEIILVDDWSSDNSWSICKTLSEKYNNVYCFQNEKNRGVSHTRNHGLAVAKGKYILFVDSDDWVSGKYAINLWKNAKKYDDSLVVCGLHFHDNVNDEKRDYLWQQDGDDIYIIKQEHFFELQKKFHLQQLWNKIFHREIIEKFHIRFDESQNMGEDFQFVLDYMEAAKCKECVVLNEALYYYVRASKTSLMSQFGLIENKDEYKRLEKLLRLSNENGADVHKQYLESVQRTKMSYIYSIVRTKQKTKNEKLSLIEAVMQDGRAKKYYYEQQNIVLKERIIASQRECLKIVRRIQRRVQREKNNILIKKMRGQLKNKEITIISQNCIGGVFYHDMGQQFLSPTINLFFKGADFVKFVLNLKYYMKLEIEMVWGEEYPIGVLEDVKIYFMHYQTCTEAKEAWNKRKARIRWDRILVLCTDMEEFSEDVYNLWKTVQYSKVLFTAEKREDDSCVYFSQYEADEKVTDLIPKREFYKDGFLVQKINNMMQ